MEKFEYTQEQRVFQEGDCVIIYEDRNKLSMHYLKNDGFFTNQFGSFLHDHIIGKPSGSKIFDKKKQEKFIFAFEPSPQLLTLSLSHKTQIIYEMDIAQIIQRLNILPGSIVVESGTGSGSLSCSIIQVIQNSGHLHTFEFNQDRVNNAKKVFKNLKFENVTVYHRDSCGVGFLPQSDEDIKFEADAVFLDLPKNHEAIKHGKAVLKTGGKICCFSPCIEQVQTNSIELKKQGFINIVTIESLVRSYDKFERNEKNLKWHSHQNTQNALVTIFVNLQDAEEDEEPENPDEADVQIQQEVKNQKRKHNEAFKHKQENLIKKPYYTSGSQFTKGHTAYLTFAQLV